MVTTAQLGITTKCISQCYFCFRLYLERECNLFDNTSCMDIETYKNILFNDSLRTIHLCGNRGEALCHPKIEEFINLTKEYKKNIILNTNGGLFDKHWWYTFGKKTTKNDMVIFALDGLQTSHEYYRKTKFTTVFNNMKAFISGGGSAIWQMILFRHNEHEVDIVKSLAKHIGCTSTWIINSREYNDRYQKPTMFFNKTKKEILIEEPPTKIRCLFQKGKKVYIGVDGEVWPCCHTRCQLAFKTPGFEKNKYVEIARSEKDFINAKNTKLETIVNESMLFRTIFNNRNNMFACKMWCGNPDIVHTHNRRTIIN